MPLPEVWGLAARSLENLLQNSSDLFFRRIQMDRDETVLVLTMKSKQSCGHNGGNWPSNFPIPGLTTLFFRSRNSIGKNAVTNELPPESLALFLVHSREFTNHQCFVC